MNIILNNLDSFKAKILQSTVYNSEEKYQILRHKHSNYDSVVKNLSNKRINRAKEYKAVVENLSIATLRAFPQLKSAVKAYYIAKLS